jgi:RNA polymerase sigma-70 factor (ECF subfamily)
MAPTDEELMRRFCAGDAEAFERLYQDHREPVYRYVQRLAGAGIDAESVFQDVWMRVIEGREQWRQDRLFRPWLYGIAHNLVIDRLRRDSRFSTCDADTIESLPSAASDLDIVKFLQDCITRLQQLLGLLPEAQRSAFLLQQEGGLSLAQIADVTGVTRETVKSRLRYATRRLKAGLEGCDNG